ncbi:MULTISPECIES: SGNH/GDSL hydrolase family protein [Acinetobacter]|jgi:lysophospholipase L1-like esterase|uniref:SGNH/GDSL hydrolase family protein n=1 Tax=Acinetobacter TaxID=469 RepID=UPI000BC4971D|nr:MULTISPECIES: SGNH/GDSL hydrolase family protein [Acinetobacter]GIT84114.1 lipase [Acinetobacter seohaensis]MBT0887474.1 SGNH/GDSL hydrolase family protein [Acinetobacter towneri]MCO8048024.1 SGNH/GDSL hydrolase family protein [Acinetobacter towneri]MDM1282145.1 SGNH/GDSL hydrolase family protein [Acinetobacter towneri]MDV2456197.1 SGNH/GDSL hydrolase family protein [Acinetobacter towneri]
MWLRTATLALIPALVIQGSRVKKNTIRLPEAEGAREGITGQGQTLSLLILGDSAAAGVGVAHQNDALLGAVISALQHQYQVHWRLEAQSGDTTSQVIQKTKKLVNQKYDVVVTSVGVNDVTRLMSAQTWIKQQQHFYQLIQAKFQPELIIATGVPPMHLFPALPNPLSWLFGQYAKQMNLQLEKMIAQQEDMQWIEYDIRKYQSMNLEMAKDGFHPSKEIYQIWGKEVAEMILERF